MKMILLFIFKNVYSSFILSSRKSGQYRDEGVDLYYSANYGFAVGKFTRAIELTLGSRDSQSVKLVGALYEYRAFALLRMDNKAMALLDAEILKVLNRKNILGLACFLCCTNDYSECLIAVNEFAFFSNKISNIHGEIEKANATFDYSKVRRNSNSIILSNHLIQN